VDVIILARGGGSLEDLWAFNDEELAQTIAACSIPIVAGVGHEVDFTIADFVADVRAPTPSAAAELVTPDKAELKRVLHTHQAALLDAAHTIVNRARTDLQHQTWALERVSPQATLNNNRQRIDTLINRAEQTVLHMLSLRRAELNTLAAQLATLNPEATLERGYAIVQKGQAVVSSTKEVSQGDDLLIQVSDGEFRAKVSQDEELL
jgi:exodeoxyribonuclease VII large subunit